MYVELKIAPLMNVVLFSHVSFLFFAIFSLLCLCYQSLMAKLSSMKITVSQMQYEKQRMEQKCQTLKVE